MKILIEELPSPPDGNRYFYTVEKALYGGLVLRIELETDLKLSGTLDDPDTAKYWKPIPH